MCVIAGFYQIIIKFCFYVELIFLELDNYSFQVGAYLDIWYI